MSCFSPNCTGSFCQDQSVTTLWSYSNYPKSASIRPDCKTKTDFALTRLPLVELGLAKAQDQAAKPSPILGHNTRVWFIFPIN